MPIYIFECYQEDAGCGCTFEIQASMNESTNLKPTCPKCRKRRSVSRNYQLQDVLVNDGSPKTIGALADRNTSRMSTDQKKRIYNKNNAYKQQPFTGSLPSGGSLIPTDHLGKRIASDKQKDKDPRR